VTFQFSGLQGSHTAVIHQVDADHGSLLKAYAEMGSPRYPTHDQIERLRQAAQLPPPEQKPMSGNQLTVDLPAQSLVVVEVK
jgi:xylan 1,4-beta-xylosidase